MKTSGGISRRSVLKAMGTIGVTPALSASSAEPAPSTGPTSSLGPAPSAEDSLGAEASASAPATQSSPRASRPADLARLSHGGMTVSFDRRLGTLYAITRDGDPFATNFLGNSANTRGVAVSDTHWTGDLVATVWEMREPWDRTRPSQVPGSWVAESTLQSDDTRRVAFDGRTFTVSYSGASRQAGGIRSFDVSMRYRFDEDGALVWEIEIANRTGHALELGELAIPLRVNDDYAQPYKGVSATTALRAGRMPEIQKVIHEQNVFAHAFVAGHSSYVLVQRPRGDGPFLLVHPLGDTSFECLYKVQGSTSGTWLGTDLLAIHSHATCSLRGWDWNPWVNGHTSLVLEPGARKKYSLRFAFIDSYAAIRQQLVRAGNLGIRILPSMVIQEGDEVRAEVGCREDLEKIEGHSDGVTIVDRKRTAASTLLTLRFQGRGQKTVRLVYGGGRWTNLHFFCVPDAAGLIKARARFMADRQFYVNPDDPWGRNHLFLPFDYRLGTRIDDHDEVWEVGGTGDPGFGEPLFLSEKNAHYPSRDEVEKLELYVSDCLFGRIQDPKTYEIRASLYWKPRYPSSYSSVYTEARSKETWRTYNYAFAANIYHALYRIGREYDVLTHRTAHDYLRLCYETCRKWFTTGPYVHVGMITGCNAVEIVEDLRREGWSAEVAALTDLMRSCNDEFLRDPYPYCSEIEIDETGQSQVFFFTRHFGQAGDARSRTRSAEVLAVLQAMRGGEQPVWFCYGNDLFAHPDFRGQIACWHAESLNGLALLRGYEDTGEASLLIKGYAGVMSVLHNILPEGMGFGWFRLDPGVYACDPARTFEGGPGLWGFLRAAKSYVIDDPAFGRVGVGCRVEQADGALRVVPRDGVRKRVRLVADRVEVRAWSGEIAECVFDAKRSALRLSVEDSTGLVRAARLEIEGLPKGAYLVRAGGGTRRHDVDGVLALSVPIGQAAAIAIEREA